MRRALPLAGLLAMVAVTSCGRPPVATPLPALPTAAATAPATGPLATSPAPDQAEGTNVQQEPTGALTASRTPAPTTTPSGGTPVATRLLESERYGVTLLYPAAWEPLPGYDGSRLGGQDGFLQLDAAQSPDGTIDAVTDLAAHHQLLPYGSRPAIEHLIVAGQTARLILPSADQPAAMAGEACLIVAYPAPRTVGGDVYAYLVIYGDADRIVGIATSLAFAG